MSSICRWSCEIKWMKKHPCHTKLCAFWGLKIKIKFVGNHFFLKNNVTSEGAVSHSVLHVLYHQQLHITCYQVKVYANSCFEKLPIMSTAFTAFHIILTCTLQRPFLFWHVQWTEYSSKFRETWMPRTVWKVHFKFQ